MIEIKQIKKKITQNVGRTHVLSLQQSENVILTHVL